MLTAAPPPSFPGAAQPPGGGGQPLPPPFLGLIVPGGPVRTDFAPVDNSGQKFSLQLNPNDFSGAQLASVTELVVFLLPNGANNQPSLPPDRGVLLYWQISAVPQPGMQQPPASTGFELLGAVTRDRPSAVLATRWGEHEQVLEASASNQPLLVNIGVSVEPLPNVQNILGGSPNDPHQGRLWIAQRVANDLFTFMQSFDTGAASGASQMVVPNNIFDRWFQRFERRFRRDPNFFLRKGGD